MNTIQISTSVLDWAASQVGESLYDFAKRISKRSAESVIEGVLTYSQLIKVAKTSGVSLGDLFLESPPPPRDLPFVDFRTLQRASPLGRDFFDTFDDIEFKQSWYKEMLIAQGRSALPFVGKYKQRRPSVLILAQEIREAIGLNNEWLDDLNGSEGLFSSFSKKVEDIGVLVFKNGVVGNNTRRTLSVSEFRGFAIADEIAPVIFVNGSDASAAWAFTLAHELSHIWLGDSGISDALPNTENRTEKFCNAVAAEILVPEKSFAQFWNSCESNQIQDRLAEARKKYKVSTLVVARKALDLNFISSSDYAEVYERSKKRRSSQSSGGDFYKTFATRNSKKFSSEIANLAVSGAITLGQAGRLLNTNPNNVVKFYARQNPISF